VAIPADRNAMQQEAEKKLKYKNLCTEIQRMWNVKCMIIPLITGNTGLVTKGLKKKFGSQSRKTFDSLHKAAMLGTSHIIQKVLQCET